MEHKWKKNCIKGSNVAHSFTCEVCGETVGSMKGYVPDAPDDEPLGSWVEATVGKECKGNIEYDK